MNLADALDRLMRATTFWRLATLLSLMLFRVDAVQAQKAPLDFALPAAIELLAATVPGEWSTHYQFTAVDQGHPAFRAPYSGQNSLNSGNRMAETMSATAYLGHALWDGGAVYIDPEFNQGSGLSHTFGLAGFPNGEAQKAGSHLPKLNLARFYLVETVGLGGEQEEIADDLNQIASKQDVSRLTIYAGKLAVNDLFDTNAYAHDTRNDFLNWAAWEGAAYDYAADQKGYSKGIAVELNQKDWAFRVGDFLVPKASNSRDLDTRVLQRGGYQAELEQRYKIFGQAGKLRMLGFLNRAYAGSYREALLQPATDIAATRKNRFKEGFVVNLEQAVSDDLGVFARFSWNDGSSEIMSFTDIDRSAELGVSVKGRRWGRPDDTAGVAAVVNGLSSAHAEFLRAGGLGILVGDGRLNYGTERILETYYRWQIAAPLSLTADYQFIDNPAYNRDRGPVSLLALRLHVQI